MKMVAMTMIGIMSNDTMTIWMMMVRRIIMMRRIRLPTRLGGTRPR